MTTELSISIDSNSENNRPKVLMEEEGLSITFDPLTREIAQNGEVLVRLTKIPANLLTTLIKNPNQIVPSNELAIQIWQDNFRRESGLHNLVSRVRETLRTASPLLEERLDSKKKKGYTWLTNSSLVSPITDFDKNR